MHKVDHSQAGTSSQREERQEHSHKLYHRLLHAMERAVEKNSHATLADLAAAAVSCITDNPRKRVAIALMAENGGEPVCSLCDLRIFLDEPNNSPASFTVDHVLRWADGGKWDLKNCKPAHCLCNNIRTVFDLGRQPKPKTLRKLEAMKQYLRKRMQIEDNQGTL